MSISLDAKPDLNKAETNTPPSSMPSANGKYDLRGGSGYPLRQGNIWTLDKYEWSNSSAYEQRINTGSTTDNTYPDIQKIILREFQPNLMVDVGQIIDSLGSGLLSLIFKPGTEGGAASFTEAFLGVVGKSVGAFAPRVIEKGLIYAALNNPDSITGSNAIGLISQYMFSGPPVGYYECPFFEELFLDNKGHGNWTQSGSARLGGSLASAAKAGANIDFPTTPTWALGDSKGFDFSFSFWLINKDVISLAKNFKFLQSLIAGTFWIQLNVQQKSPNVYQIIVPGRFRKFFTSLDVKVTAHGKLRRVLQTTNQYVADPLLNNLMPEVWKVEINVEDLTPNNFNSHAEFINSGAGGLDNRIEINVAGPLDENTVTKQMKNVTDEAINVTKAIVLGKPVNIP